MFQELEPEAAGADGIRSTKMSRLQKQNLTQHQLKDYQMFWMKHQLDDHQIKESNILIYYDNTADISSTIFAIIRMCLIIF